YRQFRLDLLKPAQPGCKLAAVLPYFGALAPAPCECRRPRRDYAGLADRQEPVMRVRLVLIVIVLALTRVASAQTQITTGVIRGTVADVTGASLPGVTVEARHTETNQIRTQVTEADGRFAFLQLPPGTYQVTFTLGGFATVVQQNVTLTVGETVTLPVAMKVGGVTETVTVSSSNQVVDATRTAAANTLNELTVESTPILGRKFEDLLTLTPGVSVVQGPDGDEITFAGQRGVFNNVSLDGGDYNNGFFGEQLGGQRAAIDIQ